MKKFVYILFAYLTIQSANAIENEDYYNRQFCIQESGQAEYRLPDRSRVDCLTDTHAYEADWASALPWSAALRDVL